CPAAATATATATAVRHRRLPTAPARSPADGTGRRHAPELPLGVVGEPVTPACKDGLVRLYRDEAVVVSQHKLGEADRIVTLLTRQHGLVRAVAKGVRRTKSRFGARLEPFSYIDVQLHPGRNLDTVTQVH